MPELNVATPRAVAYKRRSQDSGTGVSEDIADTDIEAYAGRNGFEVTTWLDPDLDASSWTLDRPRMQEALALARSGRVDAIVVAKLSRLTRRPRDWHWLMEAMKEDAAKGIKWTILCADFDVDLSTPGGRMIAGIVMETLAFEYENALDGYNKARRNAVEKHGVHGGGANPPLGYSGWSTRGTNKKGTKQRGPLVVDKKGAARVLAAFEAFGATENWASWSEIVSILGVKSNGNARTILTNRVYLGEAKSGEFVKPGAHEALVSEEVFERVARRLGTQAEEFAGHVQQRRSHTVLALSKVLRCSECGNVLSPHRTKRNVTFYVAWRCGRGLVGACAGMGSVADTDLTTFALGHAQAWHVVDHASWTLSKQINDATLPVLEQALIEAQAEVFRLESEIGAELPTTAKQKMAVQQARAAIQEHEASRGWIARTPEQVAEALDGADAKTLNSFLRDTVRIIVKRGPGPRAKKEQRAIENRVQVLQLTAGRTAGNESPETLIPLPVAEKVEARS